MEKLPLMQPPEILFLLVSGPLGTAFVYTREACNGEREPEENASPSSVDGTASLSARWLGWMQAIVPAFKYFLLHMLLKGYVHKSSILQISYFNFNITCVNQGTTVV